MHPFSGVNPPGPTPADPFAPEAQYELKIDTDGNAVADIAYRVHFSSSEGRSQTATPRRVEGAPVSTGREAQVTEAGDYRLFAGWRAIPSSSTGEAPAQPAVHWRRLLTPTSIVLEVPCRAQSIEAARRAIA